MERITEHNVEGEKVLVWHPRPDSKGFAISLEAGGWLTGVYDSIESALIGAKCDIDCIAEFYEMQKRVNHFDRGNRFIAVSDFDFLESEDEQAKTS